MRKILKNLKEEIIDSTHFQWSFFHIEKLAFDLRYRVNTSFITSKEELDFQEHQSFKYASRYRPTPIIMIKWIIRDLKRINPDIVNTRFIDYGCGPARVLMVAIKEGFKFATGVELSATLAEVAQKNLKEFSRKVKSKHWEIVQQDCGKYYPPSDSSVFFFYCPFGQEVFTRALSGIEKSALNNERPIFILLFRTNYHLGSSWLKVCATKSYSIWKLELHNLK